MNIYIKNKIFDNVAVIDTFQSLIWTKKYYECGDFELYLPADNSLLEYLTIGNSIKRDDDDSLMMIEKIEINTDAESGNFFLISGRSLESILARRIIWDQTNLSGKVCDVVKKFVDISCINATVENRNFPYVNIDDTLTDKAGETIQKQCTGDNLYDVVCELCKADGLGFKFVQDENSLLNFTLYRGEDHSYNQDYNSVVVFSPQFDNLISSEYYSDHSEYGNIVRVLGEGEGTARKKADYGVDKAGFDRYEFFVDARDVSKNAGTEDELTDTEYKSVLLARGKEAYTEHRTISGFSANVSTVGTYEYKTDYNLGDIVEIENEYGFKLAARIIQTCESWDENGYTMSLTFQEEKGE